MELTEEVSRNNYTCFLWHASFLALTKNFMDVDTIVPAMMIDAGGTSLHIGLLTAILIGGGKLSQLLFAPFLSNKPYKKNYLLGGINARIISLAGMALLFMLSAVISDVLIIFSIFLLIFLFSVSGGFANINYTDILGKSILDTRRKHFFSINQSVSSLGVLVSAYFARRILRTQPYPGNYTMLFLIAAVLLGLASLGFWRIREVAAENLKIKNFKGFVQTTRNEFKTNKRLVSYLLLINTQGIALILMPFLILYAKQVFGADSQNVGNYLLLKVLGGVITGSILFYFARIIRYQYILYSTSLLALLISLSILIFPGAILFPYIFLFGGLVHAFHLVAASGVLLEVTTNRNRALVTGLSGAGNILPTLFPLLGGWIVTHCGFPLFFGIVGFILMLSFYTIYRLDCKK
jgi:MFS family permease